MLLLNQIVQHTRFSSPVSTAGLSLFDQVASQVLMTEMRYVIKDDLAELCRQLVFEQADLLGNCFDLIKLPSKVVWIEWCQPANDQFERTRERIGLLVRSDEEGRKGTIQVVWEIPDRPPDVEATRIIFDFENVAQLGSNKSFRHAEHDLSQVLEHFWLDPMTMSQDDRVMRAVADGIWLAGPQLAAFCLLLLFKDEVEYRRSDPGRLNRKRQRQGRPVLLAHTEVHGRLFGQTREPATPSTVPVGHDSMKRSTCLHHVRGHFVRRGGKVFWRRPHLRGDRSLGAATVRTRIIGA